MTWEEIFAQTDRDINLQRVMNCLVFGPETGRRDWIPDRAIGPTDDDLYKAEQAYSDGDLERLTGKTPEEIRAMTTTEKRETLLALRKEELRKLIRAYYAQRGWNEQGVPTVETLQSLGLWRFLTEEARTQIAACNSASRRLDIHTNACRPLPASSNKDFDRIASVCPLKIWGS